MHVQMLSMNAYFMAYLQSQSSYILLSLGSFCVVLEYYRGYNRQFRKPFVESCQGILDQALLEFLIGQVKQAEHLLSSGSYQCQQGAANLAIIIILLLVLLTISTF